MFLHTDLMNECLELADQAMRLGEVPIAAVLARADGQIVGWGWNEFKAKRDPILHAEIAAFRDAAGRYPIDADDLILVSTLEPCIMCAGAAILTGVQTIVYGLSAPADAGMKRITPPKSPDTHMPDVVGPVATQSVLERFKQWLNDHGTDDPQSAYVTQLISLH